MVPLRLSLRNFLCYGTAAPTLDLEGIGVACLAGANGHGKSALIDAITWAVWGEARGKSTDALVYHGRRDMEVDLEFAVGAARYRAVRRRQRATGKGAGRSDVQFLLRDGDAWRPLTGATLAETDRAIRETVKLSYNTFVNSALLLQGEADRFTAAGPTERKRVLGEILELGRFDALEARARERRRDAARDADAHERAAQALASEVAALPALRERLTCARASLVELADRRVTLEREYAALRAAHDAIRRRRDEIERCAAEVCREEAALADLHVTIAKLDALIAQDLGIAATAEAVRAGYARWQDARAAVERANARAMRHHEIEARLRPLHHRLAEATTRQQAELDALQRELVRERQAAADVCRLTDDHARLQQRQTDLIAADQRIAQLAEQEHAARIERAVLLADLDRVSAAIQASAARPDAATLCPTCAAPLDAAGRAHLEQMATHARELHDAERSRIAACVTGVESRVARLAEERTALQRAAVARRACVEAALQSAATILSAAQAAAARVQHLSVARDCLRQQYDTDAHLAQVRAEAAELEDERRRLSYDPSAHAATLAREERDRHYEARYLDLRAAEERLAAHRSALRLQHSARTESSLRRDAAAARVQNLTEACAAMPQPEQPLDDVERSLASLTREEAALRERVGALTATVERAGQVAERVASLTVAAGSARAAEAAYDELARAFGTGGVQALVIETVLPEIEAEANRLLERMAEGRMRVTLETQRALRTGDTAETLQIRITDEHGPRDYEMFSGGEAFRIDLALRIALSRLLARRAGAPLPTLIIDEGFGSQDATGRERLIEAVNAIRSDFECLLIVTHIEELKAMFDTRIEVTKHPDGSVARVATA